MYEGKNKTAIQSREWISSAFLSLLREKPYNKISIYDICNQVDLSRQTFYNLFESKDDVVRYCIRSSYTVELAELSRNIDNVELYDVTATIGQYFEANKEMLSLLLTNKLELIVTDEISVCVGNFVKATLPNLNSEKDEYAGAFLIGAISGILLCWFKKDFSLNASELSQLMLNILSGQYAPL